MQNEDRSITPDCQVTLHYSLTLSDGTEVVSTFDDEPLSFTMGDGTMVEALEQSLLGLTCGTEDQLILSGDETFGPETDEKIQRLPKAEFPAEMDLAVGQVIAFDTPGGDEVAGQVIDIHDDQIVMNFNHPLSGHLIMFRFKILKIEPTSGTPHKNN